jgi:hypothetical protein
MNANITVHDMGNNESIVVGIFEESDGTFLALTFSESKSFKTYKGARAWLLRRGVKVS